jgi:hypothetical protein
LPQTGRVKGCAGRRRAMAGVSEAQAAAEAALRVGTAGTLNEALLAVQGGLSDLQLRRNEKGEVEYKTKTGGSGRFEYLYLSYPKLLEQVRPMLTRNGLVWQTFPTTLEGVPALRYRLLHAPSSQAEGDVMKLMLDKQTSQAQGSGLTYARRQALMAVLEITPDGDDDGRAASKPARPAPVDPEAALPEESVNAMLEAIGERGLSRAKVLERAGIADGAQVTVADGRKVKAILDAHDTQAGGS